MHVLLAPAFMQLSRSALIMGPPAQMQAHQSPGELFQLWRSGRASLILVAFSWMLGQVGEALEVQPGEEFRVALLEAQKVCLSYSPLCPSSSHLRCRRQPSTVVAGSQGHRLCSSEAGETLNPIKDLPSRSPTLDRLENGRGMESPHISTRRCLLVVVVGAAWMQAWNIGRQRCFPGMWML